MMSSRPLPQVRATLSLSWRSSLVGYSGNFRRLKLGGREREICQCAVAALCCTPWSPHHVLAVGSLLGVYSTRDIVNFVSPVAPTRLENPPRGTLELYQAK